MTGPVGGAGELTALLDRRLDTFARATEKHLYHKDVLELVHSIKPIVDELAALAAKAPQGVPADSALCPECRSTDNHPYVTYDGVAMRACGRCMIEWRDDTAPRLPAPVSDDTIHHGMVPPAEVYVRGKTIREVCGGAVISFSTMNGPFELTMEREDYMCEAAAPKPAPPDEQLAAEFTAMAVEHLDKLPPDEREQRVKEFSGRIAATPAPGAEPLHSLLPGAPVGEALRRLEHEVAVHILSESPAQEFMDDIKLVCRTLREALAAAPRDYWDTWFCHAHKPTEAHPTGTCFVCNALRGAERDRHASAERVRELIATWRADAVKYQGGLPAAKVYLMCADALERALPPSTGEKDAK